MNKLTLPSGTYAVDDILQGFDIIEKPSSNVAFVGTCMITHQMYVQFKNGSGYMYNEVDYDTLSAVSAVDSIGKFISSQVVKKFESEKLPNALISLVEVIIDDPCSGEEVNEETRKEWLEKQFTGRLTRKSQTAPVIEITGFDKEPEF